MIKRSTYLFLLIMLHASLFIGEAASFDGETRISAPRSFMRLAQLQDRPILESDEMLSEAPRPASETSTINSRVERLERELRMLTGQNEELQHKVQLLEDQLKNLRPDVTRPADTAAQLNAPSTQNSTKQTPNVAGLETKETKRSDAFNPANDPNAIGAPKQLGATAASPPLNAPNIQAAPVQRDVGQPMDIAHGRLVGEPSAPVSENERTKAQNTAPATPTAPANTKEEYEAAVAILQAGKLEAAEKTFSNFLVKNNKTKFAPAATFYLGESFYLRNRYREAAEKYLEITTKYAQSGQAPDALLRLGQSLAAMGAKEQACASFREIAIKYPSAFERVKEAATRESKKISC